MDTMTEHTATFESERNEKLKKELAVLRQK